MKKVRLLVVCGDTKNVFVEELRSRQISFHLVDSVRFRQWEESMLKTLSGEPHVILMVNKGLADGLILKKHFPSSKVLICTGGGRKDFQPYLVNINLTEDHDYYNYTNWAQFVALIKNDLPEIDQQLRFVKEDVYQLIPLELDSLPKTTVMLHNWQAMLRCAVVYLGWLYTWLEEVGAMEFPCHFSYSAKTRLKRLTIKLPLESMVHRGKGIFIEDQIIYFRSRGSSGALSATIVSVTDEGITISFGKRRISTEEINNIIGFGVIVAKLEIVEATQKECNKWLHQTSREQIYNPMRFISGLPCFDHYVTAGEFGSTLNLSMAGLKILRDQSQMRALREILSPKPIALVQGPPGAGKTFVTAITIKHLLSLRRVVVVTSHSNQGLDNILSQTATLLPKKDHGKIIRLGNHVDVISPLSQKFHRSMLYQRVPLPKNIEPNEKTRQLSDTELSNLELVAIEQKIEKREGVVLFVTVNSFISDETMGRLLNFRQPEVTFVDEATKSIIYEILPILRETTTKVIFVGDTLQLGNIDIPDDAKEAMRLAPNIEWGQIEYFVEGLFYALIKKQILPSVLLSTNRRSLSKIALLVSQVFYDSKLTVGRFNPFAEGEVSFLDTRLLIDNQEKKKNTSFYNPIEKNLAVKQYIGLVKRRLQQGGKVTDCAIITPYKAQIHEIKKNLRKELLFNKAIKLSGQVTKKNINSILDQVVNTVDAFQGSERYGIVLSLVRSNYSGEIGFNQDLRRLNVALSRPQDELIIIGNSDTFLTCYYLEVKEVFANIISFIKQNGRYLELKN